MWIRSQDKKSLLKVDCIEYDTKSDQITEEMKDKKGKPIYIAGRPVKEIVKETKWHCIYVNGKQCAKYSTEEKAMKVLDMIQEQIENMYIGVGNYMGKPFQMPQDSEVN